jgi:hypothetical protein
MAFDGDTVPSVSLLLNRIFDKIVSNCFLYFKYTANLRISDGIRKDNQSADE